MDSNQLGGQGSADGQQLPNSDQSANIIKPSLGAEISGPSASPINNSSSSVGQTGGLNSSSPVVSPSPSSAPLSDSSTPSSFTTGQVVSAPSSPFASPSSASASTGSVPSADNSTSSPGPQVIGAGAGIVSSTNPASASTPTTSLPQNNTKKRNKKLTIMLAAVGALLLIGGGSAAAYFGYVVPNRPDNVVMAALANLAEQDKHSINSKFDMTPAQEGGMGVALDVKSQFDLSNNQSQIETSFGMGGTKFSFDIRTVEKEIYLKAGNLDGISELVNAFDPSIGTMVSEVNDQWYVVDRSFWSSMGEETSCVTDLSFALNDNDIKLLKAAYEKHPLFKVKESSKETVDNVKTTKFILDPTSDQEAKAFAGELNDLSVVKNVKNCLEKTDAKQLLDEEIEALSENENTSAENTTTALYVTGDKKVKKLELTGKDDQGSYKLALVFDQGEVNITKPEGAKPIQDLLGVFTSGFMNSEFSTDFAIGSAASVKNRDAERINEMKNLQIKLETYFNDNGNYPASLTDLGNLSSGEITGPNGDVYVYQSNGSTFTLSAELEDKDNRDATDGKYVIQSINTD